VVPPVVPPVPPAAPPVVPPAPVSLELPPASLLLAPASLLLAPESLPAAGALGEFPVVVVVVVEGTATGFEAGALLPLSGTTTVVLLEGGEGLLSTTVVWLG